MGITMTATGAFRETGASFFFIPKGALTHHCPKGSGGIPPVGRVVRSSRSIHRMLLQRGQTIPQFFKLSSLPVRLAEGFRLICIFAANHCSCLGTTCHPPAKTCHSTRHALRVRQLSRSYGRCIPCTVHFLLSRQKKQKRPLWGRKEVKDYGDLSSGSEGREPWYRPFRLCGFRLSELFLHLQRL